MENILITGIAGSGGSYLAEYIVEFQPQVQVHGLARWHSTTSQHNLELVKDKIVLHECDMLDLPSMSRILREIKPTKIFNLASHANVRVCFDTPIAVLNNNIMSTANLLEAIRLECPDTIYQHCSTSEVYGNVEQYPITESHPLKPVNPYAVSKLAQESLTYSYYKSFGLRAIITRMFAYINPRRRELFATAFAKQIVEIERGQKSKLRHGNLESLRTLIDVRDAMETYWIACDKCEIGVPYNIGGKSVISVGEFLQILCKHASVPIPCELDPKLLRPTDITNQVPDVSKFEQATGWTPKYSFDDSVEFLLNHIRAEV
jgi:GDPmannose 4,6-dehydratase/GDP-4-dehydro-6-deoxy-D-mannose reductase